MLIRLLRESDFDDMVEVFYSFFAEAKEDPGFGLSLYHERPGPEYEQKWFAGVLKGLADGNMVVVVAEVDSHVVGWCSVERVHVGTPSDHRGVLGICVKKEFRGGGIGTALMKETIARCRGRFEIIELTVLANNKRAAELYRRLGFLPYGRLPKAVKRGGRYFDHEMMYLQI